MTLRRKHCLGNYFFTHTDFLIRRPLLARGTKAAGLGLIVFLTFYQSALIAFQAIQLCFYVFRGLKIPHDLPHQIHFSRSGLSLKIVSCSSLFSRPKKSEKQLTRHQTNNKNRSRNSLNTISMRSRFLHYFPCENKDLEVPNIENWR